MKYNPLPSLLTFLTGDKRYLPTLDFNWRGNIAHSLLMCYYAVFWRKFGIRVGGLSYYQDSTGRRAVGIQSIFGAFQYLEHEVIRQWQWDWGLEWQQVPILQPVFAGMPAPEPKYKWVLLAIAYEEGEGSATGTSTSPQLDNVEGSGSNRLLITHLNYPSGTINVAPTFGGSASTIINTVQNSTDGNALLATYRLVAPSTSSGSITCTLSGSVFWKILAQTYSGIDQTTPTATEGGGNGTNGNVTPLDVTSTSDLNGSWHFISMKQDTAGDLTAGTSTTRRQTDLTPFDNAMFDSNAGVNASSNHTISVNWAAGGQRMAYQKCMLRPADAPSPSSSLSPSISLSPSLSPSASISLSPSASPSPSSSISLSPSSSISLSPSSSQSPSASISLSPSVSVSASPSATPSPSISLSPSASVSLSPSASQSPSSSVSLSPSVSVSLSPSVSISASVSPSPDLWTNMNKHSSTFSNATKSSSLWTNTNKS